MKISSMRLANLVGLYIMLGAIAIVTLTTNDFRTSQDELKKLYQARLDSCIIRRVIQKSYQGGRGNYSLFNTSCNFDYYPIMLAEDHNPKSESLFRLDQIIYKERNSTKVIIRLPGEERLVDFVHPEDEDSRLTSLKMIGGLTVIMTLLILFAPMSRD